MKRLDTGRRIQMAAAFVEGMSIRATARMTGVAFNTALKFVEDMGWAASIYLDEHMRGLTCARLQCDEMWGFVYAKAKNVPTEMRGTPGVGSVWIWIATDADTKLVPCFHVGTRDGGCAWEFMQNLAPRLTGRIQLTTDGHKAYLLAVHGAFGREIDYAMLVKLYGEAPEGETRYSPPQCLGTRTEVKFGDPDPDHISTKLLGAQQPHRENGDASG